jgi:hypothetical protein
MIEYNQKLKHMITITTNHDWAKTIKDLKEGLINTIQTEQEEYQEDGGWWMKSDEEIIEIVDRYLNEVTDDEIDNFNKEIQNAILKVGGET